MPMCYKEWDLGPGCEHCLISLRARREDSSLHIPARPRCALKQLNSVEKNKDRCTCSKEMVAGLCAPQLPQATRERRPQKGQLQGRSSPSFQELKQEECRWRLCHCLVMSIESGSSRRDVLEDQHSGEVEKTALEKALTAEH